MSGQEEGRAWTIISTKVFDLSGGAKGWGHCLTAIWPDVRINPGGFIVSIAEASSATVGTTSWIWKQLGRGGGMFSESGDVPGDQALV